MDVIAIFTILLLARETGAESWWGGVEVARIHVFVIESVTMVVVVACQEGFEVAQGWSQGVPLRLLGLVQIDMVSICSRYVILVFLDDGLAVLRRGRSDVELRLVDKFILKSLVLIVAGFVWLAHDWGAFMLGSSSPGAHLAAVELVVGDLHKIRRDRKLSLNHDHSWRFRKPMVVLLNVTTRGAMVIHRSENRFASLKVRRKGGSWIGGADV